jgi:UDP-glucuronate 4-epimerase
MNLGCSCPVENIDFVRVIERLLHREAKVIDTPTPSSEPLITYADVSKARRLLGYNPRVNVEEGLAHFVNWMRAAKHI